MAMPTGMSLHIGLNGVNPEHYKGWAGRLYAAEADAQEMFALAKASSFQPKKLIKTQATRAAVMKGIEKAADTLKAGDMFLLTYSGHGGFLPDTNNDEDDSQDETWCLYDGQLIDDELFGLFSKFKKGVRVLILSDSCNSGTVSKPLADAVKAIDIFDPRTGKKIKPHFRRMSATAAVKTYKAHRDFYNGLQKKVSREAKAGVQATVRLISGCQDDQQSMEGTFNGLFTSALLKVWDGGKFKGNYGGFHKAIAKLLPPVQKPNHFVYGPANAAFAAQRPFTVAAP
jgi:hypothetical protein